MGPGITVDFDFDSESPRERSALAGVGRTGAAGCRAGEFRPRPSRRPAAAAGFPRVRAEPSRTGLIHTSRLHHRSMRPGERARRRRRRRHRRRCRRLRLLILLLLQDEEEEEESSSAAAAGGRGRRPGTEGAGRRYPGRNGCSTAPPAANMAYVRSAADCQRTGGHRPEVSLIPDDWLALVCFRAV